MLSCPYYSMENILSDAPGEETYLDRLKKYHELIATGIGDKKASETVWPTIGTIIKKPIADAAVEEKK